MKGIINVKHHGAYGDGAAASPHNDTAAIQKAAKHAAGKTLYFPPGTYIVDQTITLGNTTTVMGAGMDNSTIRYTGGAGDVFLVSPAGLAAAAAAVPSVSAIAFRDLGVVATATSTAITLIHAVDLVYAEFANLSLGGAGTPNGPFSEGTNWINGILIEVTPGWHVPPQGSIQFRNILYVVEPPSSGNVAQGNAAIWVKGLPTPQTKPPQDNQITHVTFEGWGDLEHAAFGIRLDYVSYGVIGPGWQITGTDTCIALHGCQSIDIDKPEVSPALNGVTLDAGCAQCSVDCWVNVSSSPSGAVPISDLGQQTRYRGVSGPAGLPFTRAALKMIGPNSGGSSWKGSDVHWNNPDYVLNGVSWTPLDWQSFDLAIQGRPGDWVEVSLSARCGDEATELYFDAVSFDGKPGLQPAINSWGNGGAPIANGVGVPAWGAAKGVIAYVGGSALRQLTQNDCFQGWVYLRLNVRGSAAVARTIYANATIPIVFSAVNHGQ